MAIFRSSFEYTSIPNKGTSWQAIEYFNDNQEVQCKIHVTLNFLSILAAQAVHKLVNFIHIKQVNIVHMESESKV